MGVMRGLCHFSHISDIFWTLQDIRSTNARF